ncbi:MAG TPA: hypothetical protein VFV65_04250 [Gemmatimonadales bacterium]|nr:hypothetical protein [Gemmatimonadales bacterium]
MTRYWIKIAVGALLVFAVGMLIWTGVRKGARTADMVLHSADPITIPLKFVNFRVDGASLGRLEQLKLLRAAPQSIEGVEVTVRLDSAAMAERLQPCAMRIDDLEHMNERTTFVCVTAGSGGADSGFEQFGTVVLQGTDVSLPLLLPATAVREIRNQAWPPADSMAPPIPAPPAVKVEASSGPAPAAAPATGGAPTP